MDAGLTVFAKGRFCRYDEAKIGLMTHALHYGTGCFEGVRGFWSARDEELYLFQLEQHYERLHASAKILIYEGAQHGGRAGRDHHRTVASGTTSAATSTCGR